MRAPEVPVPPGVAFSCPADFGEVIILVFGYTNGSTSTIRLATSGCASATNGDRTVRTPNALLIDLEARLGHDPFHY